LPKYKIRLLINQEPIGIKEFVATSFGNVIIALLRDLKEINLSTTKKIHIKAEPESADKVRFKLQVDSITLDLNQFVQEMIHRTLLGFISSLHRVPSSFPELMAATIQIDLEVLL
jgi:hypothetical protein